MCKALLRACAPLRLGVGEGAAKTTLEAVRTIAAADPAVDVVSRLLTLYLGPEDVLLTIEIRFHSEATAVDIRDSVARIKSAVQARFPKITRIYFDAASISAPAARSQNDEP
jgi:hypothetical protein